MKFKVAIAIILAIGFSIILSQSPSIAADGLLHPMRRQIIQARPDGCKDVSFKVGIDKNLTLKGWECEAVTNNQANIGTIVYLHGVADNCSAATGIIPRFMAEVLRSSHMRAALMGNLGVKIVLMDIMKRKICELS